LSESFHYSVFHGRFRGIAGNGIRFLRTNVPERDPGPAIFIFREKHL